MEGVNLDNLIYHLQKWGINGNLHEIIPELFALQGVQQPPEYHAEGDAFIHTLLAVAAVTDEDDERIFWAALLHDVGKALTTRKIENRWRSLGHDRQGAKMAKNILVRLGKQDIAADVSWLVANHHFALSWGEQAAHKLSPRQQLFCANPLFPLLCRVCRIDAIASVGGSNKGDLLSRIEQLALQIPE
jgi:putative nucleotidyltransferase with HDIG domain